MDEELTREESARLQPLARWKLLLQGYCRHRWSGHDGAFVNTGDATWLVEQ